MGEAVPYFKPAAFLHVGIRNPLGILTPPFGEDKTSKQASRRRHTYVVGGAVGHGGRQLSQSVSGAAKG